jgi:hypothetical protein
MCQQEHYIVDGNWQRHNDGICAISALSFVVVAVFAFFLARARSLVSKNRCSIFRHEEMFWGVFVTPDACIPLLFILNTIKKSLETLLFMCSWICITAHARHLSCWMHHDVQDNTSWLGHGNKPLSLLFYLIICSSICIAIAAEAVSPCRLSLFAAITDGVFVHANNNNTFSWAWWCNHTVIQQQYES